MSSKVPTESNRSSSDEISTCGKEVHLESPIHTEKKKTFKNRSILVNVVQFRLLIYIDVIHFTDISTKSKDKSTKESPIGVVLDVVDSSSSSPSAETLSQSEMLEMGTYNYLCSISDLGC